jgi:hypothetical protein
MLQCMYSEMFVVMVGYINESSTFLKKKKKKGIDIVAIIEPKSLSFLLIRKRNL